MSALQPMQRYKLLTGLVVPRPIALVTTRDRDGIVNAAPFSFFNAMGADPPVVVIGIGKRPAGHPKDTVQNVLDGSDFVVNIVDEALAEAMNICAIDLPAGTSELKAAGLTAVNSKQIVVPYIAESPASFECRQRQVIDIGSNRIVLGEIVHIHLRDDLFDEEHFYVLTEKLHAIGRMHGGGWYTRTGDTFNMPRWASLEEALAKDA